MIVRACPRCQRKNRIPPQHLADTGKCGQCGETLSPVDAPLDVSSVADFDAIVGAARVPVLIDFWAEWCGPCRMVAPEVAKTARAASGGAVVVKVDTEALPELAARHGVQGIPSFVVYSHGRVVQRQTGAVDHQRMIAWLDRAAHGDEPRRTTG